MSALTRDEGRGKGRRRGLLRLAALAGVAVAVVGSSPFGCATPFDPQSVVDSVRILSVDVDRPFAAPGETATFKMTVFDGRDTGGEFTPLQILWIGGCFNPPGAQYYGCFEQLGKLFADLGGGGPPPPGLIGFGDTFELTLPDTIVSELPAPATGQRVGIAYVFFLACAGEVKPVVQQGDTSAGYFPIGCFDADGNELGAEAFVPGYTQIYAFEDGRENPPPPVAALRFDGDVHDAEQAVAVDLCGVTKEDRAKSGCAATDEFAECTTYPVDIDVEADVADLDPESKDKDGNPLREVVWVDYFADGGEFDSDIKLVSDAVKGLQESRAVNWVPPDEAGLYRIWAVVRDNRGGSTTLSQLVEVKKP